MLLASSLTSGVCSNGGFTCFILALDKQWALSLLFLFAGFTYKLVMFCFPVSTKSGGVSPALVYLCVHMGSNAMS